MSSSETSTVQGADAAIALLAQVAESGASIADRDLTRLITAAVKLYASAVERAGSEPSPVDGTIATTEAMVLACALVRSQDLNPFDLALWFAHTDPKPPRYESSPQ
jgi:hypothetical protein